MPTNQKVGSSNLSGRTIKSMVQEGRQAKPFISQRCGSSFERRFAPFFIKERSQSTTALRW